MARLALAMAGALVIRARSPDRLSVSCDIAARTCVALLLGRQSVEVPEINADRLGRIDAVAMSDAGRTKTPEYAVIEVRIRELGQLFNSLDPSPFTERDLDEDAEAYIVGWAREVSAKAPFQILVHLPELEARKAFERGLSTAIRNYFEYRAGMIERDLRDLIRVGRRSLAIGTLVLAVCVALGQMLRAALPQWSLGQLLGEGIIIFGWVANWRPAEILLYDVWAMRRRLRLYRRLADAQVEIKPF